MTTWFTSDLHHNHRKICEYTNRGMDTTQENHDYWLRELWNKQVKAGDLVYILGDVSFSRDYKDLSLWLSLMRGQKIIIKGNHDDSKILNQLKEDSLIVQWYDYKEIKIADKKACLMHYPISSWNMQRYGSFMLHGHLHGGGVLAGKILDVGIDSAYNILGEHRLFSEQDVLEYMQQQDTSTIDHH